MKPQHSVGKRFQPLGALHEKPLERSQNSDELRIDCLKKSLSPNKDPKNAKSSANKICLMCSPKKVEGHCKSVSNGNSPSKSKTWAKSKPKGKTSWKQIKSLRNWGKFQMDLIIPKATVCRNYACVHGHLFHPKVTLTFRSVAEKFPW
ncbi:hypothetical protein KUTeg_014817 [Tegillarca granosa]|uniref:Uncharacterized protein n=1 Tax=Tegillarca granosa TaxID=220873 RepID=A0ABQ9EQV5_TEGGR|nr:hypothetical protein KUTeg_014817 [Tegillarca granosa]